MEFVTALAGNPLPTSFMMLIAVASILGYYFFVIPLIESHKALKLEHAELERKMEAKEREDETALFRKLSEIGLCVDQVKIFLNDKTSENANKVNNMETMLRTLLESHHALSKEHSHFLEQLLSLCSETRELNTAIKALTSDSKAQNDQLERMLIEVSRNMSNLNEKQSQILGALLGMGRIQDRNRSV